MLSCAMQILYGIGQFLRYGGSEFLLNYLLDIVNTNVNGYNIAKELFLRKQMKDMDALEKEKKYTILSMAIWVNNPIFSTNSSC